MMIKWLLWENLSTTINNVCEACLMSLVLSVIFWTGFRLYKSRHVLKVAAKGAAASARFVMKALWVQKHKYHVKWNDQQVVKCKYKFLVLVVHMWLQHILSWIDSSLMNCFTYLLFMHGAETAAEQGVHTKLVAWAHLWLQCDVTVN